MTDFGSAHIQHVRQPASIIGYKTERFSPDFIILHAQVNDCIRRMVPDASDDFTVQLDAQRLEIAHLAIRPFDKLFVYDFRIRKPFPNYSFKRWWKPQGAQTDPNDVAGF